MGIKGFEKLMVVYALTAKQKKRSFYDILSRNKCILVLIQKKKKEVG